MDDLLRLDERLNGDQRLIRDTVRSFVADRVLPHVGDWFEEGTFPARELAPQLGALGLLGMHLAGLRLRRHGRDLVRRGLPRAGGGRLRTALVRVRTGLAGDVPDLAVRL